MERQGSFDRDARALHLARERSGEPRYMLHMNMDVGAPSKQEAEMAIDELYNPDTAAKSPSVFLDRMVDLRFKEKLRRGARTRIGHHGHTSGNSPESRHTYQLNMNSDQKYRNLSSNRRRGEAPGRREGLAPYQSYQDANQGVGDHHDPDQKTSPAGRGGSPASSQESLADL